MVAVLSNKNVPHNMRKLKNIIVPKVGVTNVCAGAIVNECSVKWIWPFLLRVSKLELDVSQDTVNGHRKSRGGVFYIVEDICVE